MPRCLTAEIFRNLGVAPGLSGLDGGWGILFCILSPYSAILLFPLPMLERPPTSNPPGRLAILVSTLVLGVSLTSFAAPVSTFTRPAPTTVPATNDDAKTAAFLKNAQPDHGKVLLRVPWQRRDRKGDVTLDNFKTAGRCAERPPVVGNRPPPRHHAGDAAQRRRNFSPTRPNANSSATGLRARFIITTPPIPTRAASPSTA